MSILKRILISIPAQAAKKVKSYKVLLKIKVFDAFEKKRDKLNFFYFKYKFIFYLTAR